MAETSVFRNAIDFLNVVGIYDVILPFLLVFTIVFAILEKTKILGTEKAGDKIYTKKNLNAMVAFISSFLVVASTKLVAVINEAVASVVLVLIVSVSFLLLIGVFFKTGEFSLEQYPKWIGFFMILMFIGVVLIFLNALGWLETIIGGIIYYYDVQWVATLIMLIVMGAFIAFIIHEPKEKKEEKK